MLSKRNANKPSGSEKYTDAGNTLHRINIKAQEQMELPMGDVNQFKSEFKEALKVNPDAVSGAVDEYRSELIEYADDPDVISNMLPEPFEVYRSNRSGQGIVMNIKGEGFPDYDEIVSKAAAQVGVSEDAVRDFYTPEMHDQIFWDDVNMETDQINETLNQTFSWAPEMIVTGRSGGYWGLPLDSFIAIVNDEKFINWIVSEIEKGNMDNFLSKVWEDPEIASDAFVWDGDTAEYDGSPEATQALLESFIYDELLSNWADTANYSEEEIATFLEIDPEYSQLLNTFAEAVRGTIKYFEDPERWVENIVSNEWYETDSTDVEEEVFSDEIIDEEN